MATPANTNRPGAGHSGIGYHSGLDGIRALAIVAVLLYHGGVAWAAGGFLGVEVFFVLSGFLITSLLIAEWRQTATIALRAFWARRAGRTTACISFRSTAASRTSPPTTRESW